MTTEHASLTGANLHEPKGAATANAGDVYVSNGSGSGTWQAGTAVSTGNLLTNSTFSWAPYGASIAGVGASALQYVFPTWAVYTAGSPQGRVTVTQETGNFTGVGYSAKLDCTTAESAVATTEAIVFQTRLTAENLQHLEYGAATAKTLSVSFTIKSPKSGTHCVSLYQVDGARSYVREFTVASADTAERITTTFPGDASGTITNDTGEGLRLSWALVAGSDFQVTVDTWAAGEDYATSNQQNLLDNTANNFEITEVQLEVASGANSYLHQPFSEHRFQSEWYYKRFEGGGSSYGIATGLAYTSTELRIIMSLGRSMRAKPTISVSAVGDFDAIEAGVTNVVTNIVIAVVDDSFSTVQLTVTTSGLPTNSATQLRFDATANNFLAFTAEHVE